MARARSFALNIMRKNGIANVAQALWNGALSLDHILAYSFGEKARHAKIGPARFSIILFCIRRGSSCSSRVVISLHHTIYSAAASTLERRCRLGQIG